MKALVTGATGLIGNNLIRALLKKGDTVKALVRSTSHVELLPKKVELVHGDILDVESLKEAAKNCDIIFHAAGLFSYWGYEKQKFIDDAKQGMENVVVAAGANNIAKIIFTSSSVTIGATENQEVLTESSQRNLDDASGYILAKVQQEQTAFAAGKKTGVAVIALCPTLTVGGPDLNLTESNRIIVNYLKDPVKSTWIGGCNIVCVKDIADAMLLLAEKGEAGERYLAGSDNLEWKQLHGMISDLCGLPGPYVQSMRTASYLFSAMYELWYQISKERPTTTREQAKMVGKYYWYSSIKLREIGWQPMSSEAALIQAVSWLVISPHISASLRATIRLHPLIYQFRKNTRTA